MNNLISIWQNFLTVWNIEILTLGQSHVTIGSFICALVLLAFTLAFAPAVKRLFMRKVLVKSGLDRRGMKEALVIARVLLIFTGVLFLLEVLGLGGWIYQQLTIWQRQIMAIFNLQLFTLGRTQITLWSTIYVVVLSWLLVRLTGQLEKRLWDNIQTKTKIDRGVGQTLATVVRYGAVTIGMIVIIQSAGIDLSALTILAGAAGIALGLGLQTIINNVVSGLVILFERPIKIGDRIDVGGTTGDVARVSLRATTIVTNDDIAIIVPNADFITNKVVNWTYTGRKCQLTFPVKVAYKSDPQLVKKLLLEAADEHEGVLKKPPPKVGFDEFGESSLNFSLAVWTVEYVTRPSDLRSDLNFAISEKFSRHGVELPPPESPEIEFPAVTQQHLKFMPESGKRSP